MSRTVDERAVVMEFDNQQFESGIKQSSQSLEKFNKSLQLKSATDGIDNVAKALSKVDFMGIQSSLENIESRFSDFGIMGMTVIQNLTNAATDFVKNGLGKILGQITEGGRRRAMNIEGAHFLLQGLLDDEKQVQDVMDRAMKSVEGTAFGFDEAAKAASNFVASGIEAEKLDQYLKATSNLASATGAEYQIVSDVMGKIAGQGRILGNELQQFSSMGINAAQYIAEYITDVNKGVVKVDKTLQESLKKSGLFKKNFEVMQEDIREAISNKDTNILPDVVVEALNKKLKEIAKRANETFTGAISNVKAAMSRMGAMFYTPLVAQNSEVIKLVNAIRIAFNGLNKGIGPMAKQVTDIVLGISKFLSFIAEGIGTDNEKSLLQTKELMEGLHALVQPFLMVMRAIVEETNELFGSDWVKRINGAIFAFADWAKKGKLVITSSEVFRKKIDNLLIAFDKVVKPIREFGTRLREAFYKVFNLDDTGKNLMNFIDILTNFFNTFKGFDPNKATGMKEIVTFFEAIKSVGSSIGNTIKVIVEALLEVFDITDVQGMLTGFISGISDITKKVSDFISLDNGELEKIKTIFVDLFTAVKDLFGIKDDTSGGITDFIFGILSSIKESGILINTFELLVSIFIAVKENIKAVTENIFELLEAFGIFNSDSTGTTSTLEKISNFIHNLSQAIRDFKLPTFDGLIDFLKTAAQTIGDKLKNTDFGHVFGDIGSAIKDLFTKTPDESTMDKLKKLLDLITKAVAIIAGLKIGQVFRNILSLQNGATILNGIFNSLGNLGTKMKSFLKMGNFTDMLKEIGKTLLLFAASLYIIAQIPEDDIDRSIVYMSGALFAIIGMLELVSKIGGNMTTNAIAAVAILTRVIKATSTALIKISISLLIMAIAMKQVDDTTKIMSMFALVIAALLIMLIVMSKQSEKVNVAGLAALTKALDGLSTAMFFISMSIKSIGEVVALDPSGAVIKAFLIIMAALLIVMLVMCRVSDEVNPAKISKVTSLMIAVGATAIAMGVSMLLLAAALYIITTIPTDGLWQKVTMIIAICAALSVVSVVLKQVGITSAVGMMLMATSLVILAAGLKLLEGISWETILKAVVAVGALAAIMGIFAAVVGPAAAALLPLAAAFAIFSAGVMLLAGAAALVAKSLMWMAAALLLLDKAVTEIAKDGPVINEAFTTMLNGILDAIGSSSEKINDTMNSFVMNLVTSFVNAFIKSVTSIGVNMANSWQDIMNTFTGMGGKDKKTGAKMADATFGDFLQKIKDVFSKENVAMIKDTIVTFFGGLLDAVIELLPKVETILDEFAAYAALAGPKFLTSLLSGFGDMFGQFGEALAESDGGWTTTFEVLIGDVVDATDRLINSKAPKIMDTVFNLLTILVQKIQTWTEVNFPVILDTLFFMLGAAVTKLGEWIYEYLPQINEIILFILGGVLDATLTFLSTAFVKLMDWWNENWPTISEFLYTTFMDTLELAAKALIDSTELITKTAVELGFSVIIGFLDGIAEKLPEVTESAIRLVETIRDEVVTEENVQRIMDAGAGIILNFLNGMSEWLEDTNNIKQIRDAIGRFGNAVINAIKTFFGFDDNGNTTKGGELWNTTGNFLQGFANGIQRAWENNPVSKAIGWFTDKIKDSTNKGLDEHSPSKFTEQAAKFFTEGFVVGIKKNSKSAINAVAETTDGIKSAFSTMMEALKIVGEDEFDINPTITPVVDTSNIESAAKMANGMFGAVNGGSLTSYGAASALAADFAQNGGVGPGSAFAGNSSVVNFTQNNYSPEALSHYEVYRQTKNLLHTIDSRT